MNAEYGRERGERSTNVPRECGPSKARAEALSGRWPTTSPTYSPSSPPTPTPPTRKSSGCWPATGKRDNDECPTDCRTSSGSETAHKLLCDPIAQPVVRRLVTTCIAHNAGAAPAKRDNDDPPPMSGSRLRLRPTLVRPPNAPTPPCATNHESALADRSELALARGAHDLRAGEPHRRSPGERHGPEIRPAQPGGRRRRTRDHVPVPPANGPTQ